jgi:hypothetical protein
MDLGGMDFGDFDLGNFDEFNINDDEPPKTTVGKGKAEPKGKALAMLDLPDINDFGLDMSEFGEFQAFDPSEVESSPINNSKTVPKGKAATTSIFLHFNSEYYCIDIDCLLVAFELLLCLS